MGDDGEIVAGANYPGKKNLVTMKEGGGVRILSAVLPIDPTGVQTKKPYRN